MLASAVLAVLGCAFVTRAGGQPTDPPESGNAGGTSEVASPAFDPVAMLASAGTDAQRANAAREVLRQFTADAKLAIAKPWLAEEPAASLRLLYDAAESQTQAEALAGALVRALRTTTEEGEFRWAFGGMSGDARSASLAILSRSLEPTPCEALVAWLEASANGQRRAVAQSLVAMTGREDLGADPGAWRQWHNRHKHLPELAWRTMLAENARARAQRLAARERDLLTRLTESSRRLYAALPPAERPAVLASMLADAEPSFRLLGTELLLRDLERGVTPGPEVSSALTALLEDPQAQIRQAAAVLVDRIVPEGSAARLSVALRKEAEPDVAAVMLRAFRRAPDTAAIDAVLRWLEHGEPTRTGAMRAVLALLESGFTPTAEQTARILAIADPNQPAALVPSAVAVLARLGGDDGFAAVCSLLYADRPEIRRAAADALLPASAYVDDLLSAAEADPALLQRAADAVARHGPWSQYLSRVATIELRTPTDASAPEPLPITSGLARLTPASERLAAAQELSRRPMAVRAILGTPTRDMFIKGPTGDREYARACGLLKLPDPEPEATKPPEAEPAPPPDPGG